MSSSEDNSESAFESHFRSPQNAGVLNGADAHVRVENGVCGDVLELYADRADDGTVGACRFQVYGCPAAIAAGSVLTELVIGRAANSLGSFGPEEVTAVLGPLEPHQAHAVDLVVEGAVRLGAALAVD